MSNRLGGSQVSVGHSAFKETYMTSEQIISTILTLILGLLGMPLTTWLKTKLQWTETYALVLSAALAAALAILQLFLTGFFTGTPPTVANFSAIFWAIWGLAQGFYKLLKYGQEAVSK